VGYRVKSHRGTQLRIWAAQRLREYIVKRLFKSGSDRFRERWRRDYAVAGTQGLSLRHLYRAMAFLGEETRDQARAPRCTKEVIEEALFLHNRHLFGSLDLVFFDTISITFEGAGGKTIGRRGFGAVGRPQSMCRGLRQGLSGRRRCHATHHQGDLTAQMTSGSATRYSCARILLLSQKKFIDSVEDESE